ncbi:hypothetical protein HDV05_008326 [Chytridiales sp. JEL 0842]|nr:hypothetical protein HDV05_008326 [Chytridiales sp. JEL 0842]
MKVLAGGFGRFDKFCSSTPKLARVGGYETGKFGVGASEIVSYDARKKHMVITNAVDKVVDIIDINDPTKPTKVTSFTPYAPHANAINSVDVKDGIAAVAVEGALKTDPGYVEFWDLKGNSPRFVKAVMICSQPDSVKFSPDGKYVLLPCEGEPNEDYTVDPEGAIAIVDISRGIERATYRAATFKQFNGNNKPEGVRISSKASSVAADIEPEYITFSSDSKSAFASLQENNAIAVIDISSATVTNIFPLGLKDHSKPGFGLDVNDRDSAINIRTFSNVVGMYMPDTIAFYESKCTPPCNTANKGRNQYLFTANEGDTRGYASFNDEERVGRLTLNSTLFSPSEISALARLSVSTEDGFQMLPDGKKVFHTLHAFGARSFSVLDANTGRLLYDSGDEIERLTAQMYPTGFNSNHEASNSFDSRSSKKGPEVEVIAVGSVREVPLLFVGLERMSGVMMYDISTPTSPKFLQYVNPRNFQEEDIRKQGDLGPEGFYFVEAEDSPTGNPLLLVGNEISGSTAVFEVTC